MHLLPRAREIQAQEGLGPQIWCPPTSGHSTPLRETIPESPNGEGFPDFIPPPNDVPTSQPTPIRGRTRAGTLPSRFSSSTAGASLLTAPNLLVSKTSRPTPSTSPFKPGSSTPTEQTGSSLNAASKANLLSRLRAGSMPQRASLLATGNPFGPSVFSTSWSSVRDRSSTLASIRSSDGPSSPAQSHFSRDSLADTDVRTLDYLGLVDTPQQTRASLGQSEAMYNSGNAGLQPAAIAELLNRNNQLANRFRSYSVNNKDRYDDEEEDELNQMGYYSGRRNIE